MEWTPVDPPQRLKIRWPYTADETARLADLLRPGMLLRIRGDGGEETVILVGDVNQLAGVCDDCQEDGDVIATCAGLLPLLHDATTDRAHNGPTSDHAA